MIWQVVDISTKDPVRPEPGKTKPGKLRKRLRKAEARVRRAEVRLEKAQARLAARLIIADELRAQLAETESRAVARQLKRRPRGAPDQPPSSGSPS